jgi:hypothetical protein
MRFTLRYLTRDRAKRLIALLEEWGFKFHGTKTTQNGVENVYKKEFDREKLVEQEIQN